MVADGHVAADVSGREPNTTVQTGEKELKHVVESDFLFALWLALIIA